MEGMLYVLAMGIALAGLTLTAQAMDTIVARWEARTAAVMCWVWSAVKTILGEPEGLHLTPKGMYVIERLDAFFTEGTDISLSHPWVELFTKPKGRHLTKVRVILAASLSDPDGTASVHQRLAMLLLRSLKTVLLLRTIIGPFVVLYLEVIVRCPWLCFSVSSVVVSNAYNAIDVGEKPCA